MPGPSAYELLDGLGSEDGVKALLVFGSNVVVSAPHSNNIEAKLRGLDFLVVCDFFLSETAELADVVLPTAQWAEEEGTMTNLEGRVIMRRRATEPPSEVKDELEIVSDLADRLGAGRYFEFERAEDVFNELRRASAGSAADYSGISYDKIEESSGVFWPCPSDDHPGTLRLFADGFPTLDGRARFYATSQQTVGETPDGDYPLFFTTGRVMAHYQGTQTRRIPSLERLSPKPVAEVHPSAARMAGVEDGEDIVLKTGRGTAEFSSKITPHIRDDTVFVPFRWGGAQSANRLTNPALDPTSKMPEFKVCAVKIEKSSAQRR